jgi:peroxiredoxin
VVQLLSHKTELEALNARVTILSFSSPALAQKWIAETRSSFHFLIDSEMKTYQAYGLESSLMRAWSPKIWFAYAKLMAQGRKWRGIQGVSSQMGGDFIVDQQGVIRLAHRSHDPTDRLKVVEIFQVLDEIKFEA